MPIYEYECKHCHHQFELLRKISDPAVTQCPHCHQNEVQRLVSAAGFQLKGSGWYVTDFKDKPKTTTEAKTAPATSDAQSSKNTIDTVSKDKKNI